MKRSSADASSRSTAGCLPVPLFNQKKRPRQPLTSNPLKNEPASSSVTHDFSSSSLGWGAANPEVDELQKAADNGADDHMAPSPVKSPNALRPNLVKAGRNLYDHRAEEKTPSTKIWNRNECTPASNRTGSISGSGTTQKFENRSNNWKPVQQQKVPDSSNSSQHIKTTETSQTRSTKGQWPVKPNTASGNLQDYGLPYKLNCNSQQNSTNEKQFDCVPEAKSQDVSSFQLKLKEKRNSLRIVSAVIESMKHWSQYTYKTPILFEVLGTLDSAVTSGAYGAKNFLLRDGKESLPCVFYEIDRELPRLIRGRVLRCMGNYDTKKNIFKCVSVRPATVPEQNTFQEFVKIADVEMTAYVKTMNEI
ncbi:spermatogenesis-associated protein 22 isoform X1 [Tympanuchus pallidicinctus]|uniref:spermatogenesis-associated protein 22 isoform X1 n=1 Tax=Tympanuchus pallidicinctus TaxID=109042 RepID=UPI00228758B9|nr:spermatogenesis-associated protein 22 isoform X1 [Tympanuchus pallidicinctus]